MIDTSKINPDNKVFCVAPWLSLNINQNGDVQPCCIASNYKFGNVLGKNIEDIWNNDKIREFRKNMIEQIPMECCSACYKKELCGQKSLRETFNENLFHEGSQFIYDTNEDYSVNEFGFIHWDVKFGNKCNFKCRSCCPSSSSSIEFEENGKLSPLNDLSKINFSRITPYINAVNHLYFSGGEPLIIEEHYKMIVMLMKLEKHKDNQFHLIYNTNFSTLTYKKYHIFDIWNKFENVFVRISIDGAYKRGELIRNGFKWDKFVSNVEQFNKKFKGREKTHRLEFACTVQALNIFDVVTLHQTLFENGLMHNIDDYHLNFLDGPKNIAVWLLDKETKEKAKKNIRNHIDNFLIPNKAKETIYQFESLINYMDLHQEQHLIPEFINRMNYLDLKRGENTFKTFPELHNTWQTYLK